MATSSLPSSFGTLERYRLINNRNSYGHVDDNYDSFRHRQLYLRSYKFTREESFPEKLKTSLSKFKDAAWTVVTRKYGIVVVRKIKRKIQVAHHRIKSSGLPISMTKCLKA